jgi:hypothetical protein
MTSTIKVNNIQNQCGANIINESSNTITIGASGDTVTLASGASQSGFGRTGTVDWQTGSIKTATFTAVNGEGYFINTSGSTLTANLPAGSAGAIVAFADYNNNFATNKFTISPNGSDKIGGENTAVDLTTDGQSVTLVFVDSTEGWVTVNDSSENIVTSPFIVATGGTITNAPCGNFKIHTFTGPGTFTVCQVATTPANNEVSYVVVGAGGSGSANNYTGPHNAGAGGGAGGFRERKSGVDTYTASPLNGATPITVTAQSYPITVGGGGAAVSGNSCGNNGNTSIFSTVTSAGGGKGGKASTVGSGGSGGGGGRDSNQTGGSGNTPPVSPPQGNNGGNSVSGPYGGGGGGGGAGAVGGNGTTNNTAGGEVGGPGGNGVASSITGSPVTRAGGGGAYVYCVAATQGTGGSGGGGAGGNVASGNGAAPCNAAGGAGTDNTGGGGGGGGQPSGGGGSGVVIIRYKIG